MAIEYITDDLCEEVTICDENPIPQDCLPEGDDLVCLYTVDLDVPYWKSYWFDNKDQVADYGNYYWDYENVEFLLDKVVKTGPAGIQQEVWLAKFDGGAYNDYISGVGLLAYLNWATGGSGAVAQINPSIYLGDLIHFELDGGSGDDRVEGANNADILRGGSGNDKVIGLGGDDNLDGGDGNDKVYGGDGNDIATGGFGNDEIYGGDGDDDLSGGFGMDYIYGGNGNDNLRGGEDGDYLYGGDGHDWISGGDGGDYIDAGAGDDCVDGGAGNDTIKLGSGNDVALGGLGDDTIYGESGEDKIEGGAGNDTIYGGDGNDLVSGGDGDDVVYGGAGNDIVRGGTGDDQLWGGEGCDVFVICELDFGCNDTIEDFSAGREPDQIDLTYVDISSVRVELTGYDDMVRLDLLVGGQAGHQVLVASDDGADLRSVFERDTAYGTDDGALVKVNEGVMIDLPSTSVLFADGDGMFF